MQGKREQNAMTKRIYEQRVPYKIKYRKEKYRKKKYLRENIEREKC
jgi:hypothetical protein